MMTIEAPQPLFKGGQESNMDETRADRKRGTEVSRSEFQDAMIHDPVRSQFHVSSVVDRWLVTACDCRLKKGKSING
ncbi:hypothetical protein GC176_05290 [bacterium]|nr:hypothetical protein [bacterium]